jgi:hypothetical protein
MATIRARLDKLEKRRPARKPVFIVQDDGEYYLSSPAGSQILTAAEVAQMERARNVMTIRLIDVEAPTPGGANA